MYRLASSGSCRGRTELHRTVHVAVQSGAHAAAPARRLRQACGIIQALRGRHDRHHGCEFVRRSSAYHFVPLGVHIADARYHKPDRKWPGFAYCKKCRGKRKEQTPALLLCYFIRYMANSLFDPLPRCEKGQKPMVFTGPKSIIDPLVSLVLSGQSRPVKAT